MTMTLSALITGLATLLVLILAVGIVSAAWLLLSVSRALVEMWDDGDE